MSALIAPMGQAQFIPIPLTPESFNHDIVVERTAPRPVRPVTTASVEAGLGNTGFSWFEKGYCADWPATGLPTAGTTVNSMFSMDHEYQFAPDYRSNNAVLIDADMTHAELVLAAPAPQAALSFLLSGAHDSLTVTLGFTARHADGSIEAGVIRCPDWLDSVPYFGYTPNGRVNVGNFTFANINANLPKLFSADVALTNLTSAVTNIEISYAGGIGHSMIMALSGAAEASGPFAPIAFTGYNVDAVVEATALRPQPLAVATTASMSSGSMNTLWTWYEQGYVPDAPDTGLPAAASMLTNTVAPGQVFQLPPDYGQNNVALLDMETPVLNLTPATQVAYQSLSLLTAAAGGAATNAVVVQHENGTTQTNSLVSPEWTDVESPAVLSVAGRVNLNTRLVDSLLGAYPRLFASDITLSNSLSAVTNVLVTCPGSSLARTVFFALSGVPAQPTPSPALLSIQLEPGGTLLIQSTRPGRLEWSSSLPGAVTDWHDAGSIAGSMVLQADQGARFYRVVSP